MLPTSPIFWKKMKDLAIIGIGGAVCYCGVAVYKNDAKFHRRVTLPLLHCLDPETSHNVSIWALKHRLLPRDKGQKPPELNTSCFGLKFPSPIGLAAGYDKNGEAVEGLFRLGFGFIEIGSVTPKPQEGNPKPRLFRLTEDEAVINRYGFNSRGHAEVHSNLSSLPAPGQREVVVGVNLGQNKTSSNPVEDYREGVRSLGSLADYLVVNVSSPNTPGLRGLQSGGLLGELLDGVIEELGVLEERGAHCPPLLLKIAPDLTEGELQDICAVVMKRKVDGLIVSNTTVSRPSSLRSKDKEEVGGLSGKPLEVLATQTIRRVAALVKGTVPIIGVGGVCDGAGVYAKLRAGASLVQLYSALVYRGPGMVGELEQELLDLMRRDGFSCIKDVIGQDLQQTATK